MIHSTNLSVFFIYFQSTPPALLLFLFAGQIPGILIPLKNNTLSVFKLQNFVSYLPE